MARARTWIRDSVRPAARAVAVTVGLVALLSAPAAHAALGYRKLITIDGTRVAGGASLASFPVLVSIWNDANLKSVANGGHVASELGYDIQFRASDGTTVLDHEIERYVPQSGILVAWVRVPSLASGSSTPIYVYYGDSGVTCPLARPGDVWDANFKAVYHLQGNVLESTGLAQDAVDFGTSVTTGKVAAGRAFDGVSDFVEAPVDDLRTANTFAISLWFKANQTNFSRHILWQGQGGPLNQPEAAGANNGWGNPSSLDQEMHISLGDIASAGSVPDRLSFFLGDNDRVVNPNVVSFSVPFTDIAGWHHVAVVVQNAGTTPSAVMFLDGTQVCPGAGCDGSASSTVPAPRGNWDTPLRLGRPGSPERNYDGALDEVHVSTTARSTGWLQTEYNNQNQPQKNAACTDSGFYCLGAEQTVSAAVTSCAAPGTPGADGLLTVAGAGTVVNRYAVLAADAARGAGSRDRHQHREPHPPRRRRPPARRPDAGRGRQRRRDRVARRLAALRDRERPAQRRTLRVRDRAERRGEHDHPQLFAPEQLHRRRKRAGHPRPPVHDADRARRGLDRRPGLERHHRRSRRDPGELGRAQRRDRRLQPRLPRRDGRAEPDPDLRRHRVRRRRDRPRRREGGGHRRTGLQVSREGATAAGPRPTGAAAATATTPPAAAGRTPTAARPGRARGIPIAAPPTPTTRRGTWRRPASPRAPPRAAGGAGTATPTTTATHSPWARATRCGPRTTGARSVAVAATPCSRTPRAGSTWAAAAAPARPTTTPWPRTRTAEEAAGS